MFTSWAALSLCSWHSWNMLLSTTYSLDEAPDSRRNRVNGSARPTMSAIVMKKRGWESRFVSFFHCGRRIQTLHCSFSPGWAVEQPISSPQETPVPLSDKHRPTEVCRQMPRRISFQCSLGIFLLDHLVIILKPVSSGPPSCKGRCIPRYPCGFWSYSVGTNTLLNLQVCCKHRLQPVSNQHQWMAFANAEVQVQSPLTTQRSVSIYRKQFKIIPGGVAVHTVHKTSLLSFSLSPLF